MQACIRKDARLCDCSGILRSSVVGIQVPGVYQAGVYLWKCQNTAVSQVALFGAGYHAFLEWYGNNNTCALPLQRQPPASFPLCSRGQHVSCFL